MPVPTTLTFRKEERICSKLLINKLFNGGQSRSLTSFPLRVVYLKQELAAAQQEPVQLLISVPKRCLKHAVDRNRVKRQVREAYRHHRHLLTDRLATQPHTSIALALIWLDNHIAPTTIVEKRVRNILQRVSEETQKDEDCD